MARLFELAERQGQIHLRSLIGTTQKVLIEAKSRSGPEPTAEDPLRMRFEGRTERNEIVHVETASGVDLIGEIVEAKIVRANKHSLMGDLENPPKVPLPANLKARSTRTPRPASDRSLRIAQ